MSAVGEAIGSTNLAGSVDVIYCVCRPTTGLAAPAQTFNQSTAGIPGTAEFADQFGWSLAAGHINGDAYADLVVGAAGEAIGDVQNAGLVTVIYGSDDGLDPDIGSARLDWHLDAGPLDYGVGDNDFLGISLTTGDFDGDGHDDIAAGADRRDVGGHNYAGAVLILYGSRDGVTGTRSRLLDQGDSRWLGVEEQDYFGSAVSSSDFDADGYADLAVGAPREALAGIRNAGAAAVFMGSPDGLGDNGRDQRWHQDIRRLADTFALEDNDQFGSVLGP